MELTLFDGAKNTRPTLYQQPWSWIVETLPEFIHQERKRSNKLRHDAAIFGRCDGNRSNANVQFLSGLAADFDIGPDDPRYLDFNQMCDRLDREGFAYVAYTTTANDAPHNKFRLLMPYARDVPHGLCRAAWAACNDKFDGAIDKSTKDPARLSFLPATWTENPYRDKFKGLMTLADPFNAVRVNRVGKPILSDAEIDGLQPVITPPPSQRAGGSGQPVATDALTADERAILAHGHNDDWSGWYWLARLDGPLVSDKMRNPPPYSDDRVFKFLRAVVFTAGVKALPINLATMVILAEQFCRECLHRHPPHDLARRAGDVLAHAFRNPSQPVC